MPLEVLITYVLSAFVVVLIPGPLSKFMVANSVQYGIFKSYPAFIGGTVASSLYLIISASGVGVLIVSSPKLYLVLKILGIMYLLYLGIATIRAARTTRHDSVPLNITDTPSFRPLFKKAFLLGASNPKNLIFSSPFYRNLSHRTAHPPDRHHRRRLDYCGHYLQTPIPATGGIHPPAVAFRNQNVAV